jgi:hypothetical protein
LTGAFYPLTTNPAGYAKSGDFSSQENIDSSIAQNNSYISATYYPRANPSGYISSIGTVVYATGDQTISGNKNFTTRPTVNGIGVLLVGEATGGGGSGSVENVVFTTGNQNISGQKTFIDSIVLNVNENASTTGVFSIQEGGYELLGLNAQTPGPTIGYGAINLGSRRLVEDPVGLNYGLIRAIDRYDDVETARIEFKNPTGTDATATVGILTANLGTLTQGFFQNEYGNVGIKTATPVLELHVAGGLFADSGIDLGSGVIAQNGVTAISIDPANFITLIGQGTEATFCGTSLGYIAKCYADSSVALGVNAVASGQLSSALGVRSRALGINSIAIGTDASGISNVTVAIGYKAKASGLDSIAIGDTALARSLYAIAIGYNSFASGASSLAIGRIAKATGLNTTAIGYNATASGDNSTAIGYSAYAPLPNTLVLGQSGTNVGVNQYAPQYTLDVNGYGNFKSGIYINGVPVTGGGGSVDETYLVHKTGTENVSGAKTFFNNIVLSDGIAITSSLSGSTAPAHGLPLYLSGKQGSGTIVGRTADGGDVILYGGTCANPATSYTANGGNVFLRGGLGAGGIYGNVILADTLFGGGKVGIKNNNPQYTCDVSGNGNFSSGLYVSGVPVLTGSTEVANVVFTTGNQTITGIKTFLNEIRVDNVSGNNINLKANGNSVFLGTGAGLNVIENNLVLIGRNAGQNSVDKFNSVEIGFNAGSGSTGAQNNIFIGSSAGQSSTGAANAILIGADAGKNSSNLLNSVLIGSNIAGGVSYTTCIGYSAGGFDGSSVSCFGASAGAGANGSTNATYLGYGAGQLAINTYNSAFIGFNAGYQAIESHESCFFGDYAGFTTTGAHHSVMIGSNAGVDVDGAAYSVFLGANAGTGRANTLWIHGASATVSPLIYGEFDNRYFKVNGSGNFTSGLYVSGVSVLTGSTANFVTTGQTGQFYANSNPSGYITSSALSSYVLQSATGSYTGTFYPRTGNPSGFVTTGQTGVFYSTSNPSGYITSAGVVFTTGAQTISGNKTFVDNMFQSVASGAWATGVTVNFNATGFIVYPITGAGTTTFGTSNRASGVAKTVSAVLLGAATDKAIAFESGWNWFNTIPTGLTANKRAWLTLTCLGSNVTDVYAAYKESI